jgi:hypothetical protein
VAETILFETLAAVGAVEVTVVDQENIPNSRPRDVSVGHIPSSQEGLLVWPVTLHSDASCESEVTYI